MPIQPSSKLSNDVDYDKTREQLTVGDYYWKYSQPPEPFRPTKRGLNVDKPDVPATQFTANAVLINRGSRSTDNFHKIYLFVDKVETSWQVSGDMAQTQGSKTFYPHNLTQSPVTITGVVANQYEYDRLVRFVAHHQYIALHGAEFSDDWFKYVDFLLHRPHGANTFQHAQRIYWGILITEIAAGHTKSEFSPGFTLTCKVINDRFDKQIDVLYQRTIKKTIQDVYGDLHDSTPYVAGTASDPTPNNPYNTIK